MNYVRISFDLSANDLAHFRLIMQQAQLAAANKPPEEIIEAAITLLDTVQARNVPDFIGERLQQLKPLIEMLRDDDWALPDDEVKRVVDALCYFSEEDDLIPDEIPGLGFLDDAIMVELVVKGLAHELSAYRDFCEFREQDSGDTTRADWLRAQRTELQSRMRDKRKTDKKARGPLGFF